MARKVFISFLGTGNYVETYYQFGEKKYPHPVRFVQEAIIGNMLDEWTEDDKILIFATDAARKANWENDGQERAESEIEHIGLKQRLLELHLPMPIDDNSRIEIKEGFSEEEVWSIFNAVDKEVRTISRQGGDIQLIFDITHAFRSIPMFAMALFNYAQYMYSNVKIEQVQYGAFEKLGPTYKVKQMPLEQRIAPVVDMTNIVRLQQLTSAAIGLHDYGRFNNVINAEDNQPLRDLVDAVNKLDEYIQLCNLKELKQGDFLSEIKRTRRLAIANQQKLPAPVNSLLNKIVNDVQDCGFNNNAGYHNIDAAIKWAIKYQMFPQAASMAREFILEQLRAIFKKLNPFKEKRDFTEFLSAVLSTIDPPEKWYGKLKENEQLALSLREKDIVIELSEPYRELASIRNSLDHGKGLYSLADVELKIPTYYKECLEALRKHKDSCTIISHDQ